MPFLKKFYESFENSSRSILPARDFLVDLIQLALRKTTSASTLDVFKQAVAEYAETHASEA